MACEHDDCMTCPYPDCISKRGPRKKPRKKPGRKALPPEIKQAHRKAYDKKYYAEHREERLADSKRRYKEKKLEENK